MPSSGGGGAILPWAFYKRYSSRYIAIVVLIQKQQFLLAPSLHLPGALLSCVAGIDRLKPLIPPPAILPFITTLILTHAPKASDVSIASMIWDIPTLEVLNFKGCSLAGSKTVDAVIKRCPRLRRVNLKGTNVNENDLQMLLVSYGQQLEGLKVDKIYFEVSPN